MKISTSHRTIPKISPSVWALSLGMFFLNFASMMIFTCMPLLPLCFPIKASAVGCIEGFGEGFAYLVRAFAGSLSDFFQKRKKFLLWGYGTCLLARFCLVWAHSMNLIVLARLLEKLGNGMQGSPREALIRDMSNPVVLGRSYGLNKALGMLGSALGGGVLVWVFYYYSDHLPSLLKYIFGVAVGLSFCSFLLLFYNVKEPSLKSPKPTVPTPFIIRYKKFLGEVRSFPINFWKALVMSFFLKTGYFSGSFMVSYVMVQKFETFLGLSTKNKPLMSASVLAFQIFISTLFSYPAGLLADLKSRRTVLGLGTVALLGSLGCFGFGSGSAFWITLGVLLYGIQYGMQGVLLSCMSCTMPLRLQGTGFGIFFVVAGLAIIFSNAYIMEPLWDPNPERAFLMVGIPVLISLILLPFISFKGEEHDA
ncbi:MAG: hypothetical protein BGO07_04180 [Alphaproteobacteria bacterium 40-19]|nr:MAG: hypothetical protein BGO07_04180 [Alphaproteobacteria bacterium 40-19]